MQSAEQAAPKPKAYSYLRFSTPEQLKGDSYRRQTMLAEQWCAAHDLDLDTELRMADQGVSAFRAKNVRQGALGRFLKMVDDELVAPGSYLLVEALDRVSRSDPWAALPIFQQIIDAGVTIVTLKDQRTWSRKVLRKEPYRINELIMTLTLANIESAQKQFRLRHAWAAKRATGKTKKLTAMAPAWLRLDKEKDRFEVVEGRGEIVSHIYQMAAAGKGLQAIANTLNEENVPTFSGSEYWNRSYICKVLDNPAAGGLFVPCLQEERDDYRRVRVPQLDQAVADYYPAVVETDVFERVRAMRSGNQRAPKARIAHMLAGLAKCPVCGGGMKRENKGGRSTTAYYVCSKALHKAGCERVSVRQDRVDEALRDNAYNIVGSAPSGDKAQEVLAAEIETVEHHVEITRQEIDNVVSAIARKSSTTLSTKLGELEAALRDLEKQRQQLIERDAYTLAPLLQKRLEELEPAIENGDAEKANAVLRQLFHAVEIDYQTGTLKLLWHHSEEMLSVPFAWPREPSAPSPLSA